MPLHQDLGPLFDALVGRSSDWRGRSCVRARAPPPFLRRGHAGVVDPVNGAFRRSCASGSYGGRPLSQCPRSLSE